MVGRIAGSDSSSFNFSVKVEANADHEEIYIWTLCDSEEC